MASSSPNMYLPLVIRDERRDYGCGSFAVLGLEGGGDGVGDGLVQTEPLRLDRCQQCLLQLSQGRSEGICREWLERRMRLRSGEAGEEEDG